VRPSELYVKPSEFYVRPQSFMWDRYKSKEG
jgi:hypothetical protein